MIGIVVIMFTGTNSTSFFAVYITSVGIDPIKIFTTFF